MHTYSNTNFQDPIPVISSTFQIHSSNRIPILLILQLETDYFSSSLISEKSYSKQRHSTVFKEFQKLHSTCRRQRALRLILHTESKETFITEKKFYTQKARRSSSTSNHPTRPSKGIPGIPATRPSKDIPDIPVIHDIQPFQAILHASRTSRHYYIHPGIPPFYSILQLECMFYISIGFHRDSTEYQLRHYKHSNFILQRKGDVAISVRIDIFSRIEFNQAFVLSSDNTNYKNDIQYFSQLFDEH